jgi:hypothetical protein
MSRPDIAVLVACPGLTCGAPTPTFPFMCALAQDSRRLLHVGRFAARD